MAFSVEYIVRAVDKFSPTFNKMKKSLSSAQNRIDKFSKKMKNFGDKASDIGSEMTQKVSLPIAAVGGYAFNTAFQFEKAMNEVKAISGATGEEFKKLEELAKELGSTTQFSASQAADAQKFLAMAGLDTQEILKALPGTLDLAAASSLDLGKAADFATNILGGLNLGIEDLSRVNDVLANAQSKSNSNISEFARALRESAPFADSAKLSMEELVAILGKLGDKGIKGSQAGTAMKIGISRMLNPVGQTKEAIKELNLKVRNSEDEFVGFIDILKQLEEKGATGAQIQRLFGAEAGGRMKVLVDTGAEAIQNLTDKLEKSGGAAKEMAEKKLGGAVGPVYEFKSALEGLQIAFFNEEVMKTVTKFIKKVTEFIREMSDAHPKTMKVVGAFLLFLAVLGPIIFTIGKLAIGIALLTNAVKFLGLTFSFTSMIAGFFSKIFLGLKYLFFGFIRVLKAVRVGFILLNVVMAANPIFLVVAAIVALIAIFVVAYMKSEKFRKAINNLAMGFALAWEWIKEKADEAGEFISDVLQCVEDSIEGFVNDSIEWFKKFATAIEDFFMDPINNVKDFIGGIQNKAISVGTDIAKSIGLADQDQRVIKENDITGKANLEQKNRVDINLTGNTDAVDSVVGKEDKDSELNIGMNMPMEGAL